MKPTLNSLLRVQISRSGKFKHTVPYIHADHEIIQASQRPAKTQTDQSLLDETVHQSELLHWKNKSLICIKQTWLETILLSPLLFFFFCLWRQYSIVPDGLITGTQLECFLGMCSPDYSSESPKHTYSYKNKSAITRAAKPLL